MPAYAVNTAFTAADRVTPAFQRMGNAAKTFGKSTSSAFGQASRSGSIFGDVVGGILAANIVQQGFNLIKQGIGGIITEASKMEDAKASFTPLMGGVEGATNLVARLNKEAATTPFEFENIAAAAKQLLPVMNQDINRTAETFRMLGDTAGGNAQKLDTITRGFTKAMLKGKVDLESLNMISEAGVPIFAEMSKSLGVTSGEMFKMISAGKVTTDQLTQIFKTMTSEGGIFYKGMEISSETFSGRMSTLRDTIKLMAASLGDTFMPQLKKLVDLGIIVAGKISEWVEANQELIKTRLTQFIESIKSGVQSLIPFLKLAWKITKVLGVVMAALSPIIKPLIAIFIAYRAVMFALWVNQLRLIAIEKIGMAIYYGKIVAMKAVLFWTNAVAVATKAWIAVQWLINAALTANPIGLIVVGVAALAAGAYLIIKNWSKVKDFFVGLWEWIKGKWDVFAKLLGFAGGEVNVNQEVRTTPARVAPNAAAAERQSVNVGGEVLFRNAPPGTQIKNTSAPGVNLALAGVNP